MFNVKERNYQYLLFLVLLAAIIVIGMDISFAQGAGGAGGAGGASAHSCDEVKATTLGGLARNITCSFEQIGKLMIGVAYLAGIGFGISAVFKFKQYKDNPTQVPVGTPFALLFISVVLIYLPGLYGPAGKTIFGESDANLAAGGFTGTGVQKIPGYN